MGTACKPLQRPPSLVDTILAFPSANQRSLVCPGQEFVHEPGTLAFVAAAHGTQQPAGLTFIGPTCL